MRTDRRKSGFTLLELMMVVVVIGILSAIAIVRYNDLLRKANEGNQLGNLGTIRSALSIYYADMEGQFPADLASLTLSARYLRAVPEGRSPNYHTASTAVLLQTAADDAGGWVYDNTGGSRHGTVWVNCTHTDTKRSLWTSY